MSAPRSAFRRSLKNAVSLLLLLLCGSPMAWRVPVRGAPLPATLLQSTTPSPPSTIQRIRNRGNVLIAGFLVDYPPLGFRDDQGVATGFEVELVRALANEWGVEVQFEPVTPATRVQRLMTGQVDLVAAAMPHTVATEAVIDFSQHYFTDTPALLVRAGAQPVTLADLADKTIATVQDDDALTPLAATLTTGTKRTPLLPFQDYAPALGALRGGQADALLGHHTYLTWVAEAGLASSTLLPLAESQPFALGLLQGDTYFRNLVDATLLQLKHDGRFDALWATWFPTIEPMALEQLPGQWPYTFATAPSEAVPLPTSRLTQLQERGKLLVGVAYDFAPFGFLGDDGALQGFDIDLSRELARRWLGDATAVELVRVTPATAIPLLTAGQVDLIVAALPHTWPNRAQIAFSETYFLDGQSVLTRTDSPIQRLLDLDQKVVAVIGGLTSATEIATLTADAPITPLWLPFQEYRPALQALLGGQMDALVGSSAILSLTIQTQPGLTLAVTDFVQLPYAIGVPPFDALLRDQVNLTLQAMQVDGFYATLYQRWFHRTPQLLPFWPGVSATTGALGPLDPAAVGGLPSTRDGAAAVADVRLTHTAPVSPTLLLPTAPAASPAAFVLVPTPTPPFNALLARPSMILVPTRTPAVATVPLTVTTASSLTITIRTDVNVNARRAPTTTAPILVVLAGGANWPLLSVAPDGQWVEVQLPGQVRAWVAIQFIVEQERVLGWLTATPRLPSTGTPIPTPMPAVTATPRLLFTTSTTHRVDASDTLATIAQQYYGSQALWRLIYEANRTLIGADPNAIPIGALLVIPPAP